MSPPTHGIGPCDGTAALWGAVEVDDVVVVAVWARMSITVMHVVNAVG